MWFEISGVGRVREHMKHCWVVGIGISSSSLYFGSKKIKFLF